MSKKLKTETNTPAMDRRIAAAFSESGIEAGDFYETVFEHDQWWVICENGAQYSVVDTTGGIDGFDFEQVTPPNDE
jgi:hypothetical protein